jgi:hypothetical protein
VEPYKNGVAGSEITGGSGMRKKRKGKFGGRRDPEYIGAGPFTFTYFHILFFSLSHASWLVLNVCLTS